MTIDYRQIVDQLTTIVSEIADAEIIPRFNQVLNKSSSQSSTKLDGSVVTQADLAMQSRLTLTLKERWPSIAMLGEEMNSEQQEELLKSSSFFWCVDPLDGTSNFASGIPCFAVSIALVEQGAVKLGVIYDPVRKECYSAIVNGGCQLNGKPLDNRSESVLELKSMIAVVDLKRLKSDILMKVVREHPFRSQRNFGSCALEWCWLAANRFQVYLHGGMKIWDHAAGSLILAEAGGWSVSFDGNPVFRSVLEPRPVIAGSDKRSFQLWSRWLGVET